MALEVNIYYTTTKNFTTTKDLKILKPRILDQITFFPKVKSSAGFLAARRRKKVPWKHLQKTPWTLARWMLYL